MVTQRKLGRFEISGDFTRHLHEGEGSNLFHGMFVLRAQENYASDKIEYVAIHPDFDYCPIGQIIPLYVARFDSTTIYPKWERVK